MTQTDSFLILIVCAASLLAGFIDAVVGGGGLVQIPVLFILFPQFPVPRVVGTNRFSSFMGTAVAASQYIRNVNVPWRAVAWAAVGAAVMSYTGAQISSLISTAVMKPVILVLMTSIAVYTYRNKNLGQTEQLRVSPEQLPYYSLLVGMAIGFYNGFVGPGTGSLLVFGFVSIIGFDFLRSSATAKIINVVADVSSLSFFIMNHHIAYELALPMMACNMLGSYIGSRTAIFRGSSFIRMLFLVVVFGLIFRFGYEIVAGWLG
ncbi:sulfite exporter TauE/SafE family protein [Arsenicibacter rosenii]|uniref:Probable membrane transporter protein n=1 Tax=Arsenicibacter rosenii TaxID=1750698 RepID=A0A1S2VJP3_9BACT|nr:sulfite exporter TauE/SafE family protein [Arsenicibacter rosenii]OIN58974.1 hypothetical protein BLX24_12210 [Arsenicibacter rosenii]